MAAILVSLHRAYNRLAPSHRPRIIQELSDLNLACICTTSLFKRKINGNIINIDEISHEVEGLGLYNVKKRLQCDINQQIVDFAKLISSWNDGEVDDFDTKIGGISVRNRFASKLTSIESTIDRQRQMLAIQEGVSIDQWESRSETELKQLLRNEVRKHYGYNTAIKQSSIPGAGRGLWVEGSAPAGSIIGIFSGTVYAPQYIRLEQYQKEIFPDDNLNLIMRYDGYVIDGRMFQNIPWHPFRNACMANHPPKNELPNVIQVAYDFPAKTGNSTNGYPEELRQYIPNRYRKQPTFWGGKIDASALIESMVLIATTDLQDEEIFMNYRLPPNGPVLPEWYSPVCSDEDKRRWDGAFSK